MVCSFSAVAVQCIYFLCLPFYIVLFSISGEVCHSHTALILPSNALGIHRKQCNPALLFVIFYLIYISLTVYCFPIRVKLMQTKHFLLLL